MLTTTADTTPTSEATPSTATTTTPSKAAIWGGRVMSGLPLAFLLFDAIGKLVRPAPVVEGTVSLGFSPSVILPLGVVMMVCWVLSVVPRTAVLGTILYTGYLGGAVCTHVRMGNPLFSHTLFPIYFGVMLWGGLWLRDARVRALLPLSSPRRD